MGFFAYDNFYRAYQNEIDSYRQQNNKDPEGYQLQHIEDQVWESYIRDILKRQLIERLLGACLLQGSWGIRWNH